MPYHLIEATQKIRQRPVLGMVLGLAVFVGALSSRFALEPAVREVVPFITLFPAIVVSAVVGGLWTGIAVTGLSVLSVLYFFLPPPGLAIEWPNGFLLLSLFLITASIQLFVVHALIVAVDGLSAERDRVAVLFRELQHRVANNMGFIASLLRLERRALPPKSAHDADLALAEAEQRLETMARIHRRLYDPSIVTTPLNLYLEALATDILAATGASHVRYTVMVPSVRFDLSRLVTLSLLITEIITNSVKHGLAERENGHIGIYLKRKDERYILQIADNGQGLPEAPPETANGGTSLGMMITKSLAAQLDGELTWTSAGGTTAHLDFRA